MKSDGEQSAKQSGLCLQPEIPNPGLRIRILVGFMRLVKFLRRPFTIKKLRERLAVFEKQPPTLPRGMSYQRETIAGMQWDRLLNPNAKFVVLHFYGGGYCVRMPNKEIPAVARFCSQIGAEGYLPWYRLAPEHKFPAAPNDCFDAYQHLLAQGTEAKRIIFSGISAGGGNVLSVLAMLKQRQLPMPGCAILSSPAGDALQVGGSWRENINRDAMFKAEDIELFSRCFLEPEQINDPLLNVSKMDDFSGYPPLYFSASSREMLRDASVLAHKKALEAGVPSQLDIFPGGFHCMPFMLPWSTQSRVIWRRTEQFVRYHCANVV